MVALARRLGLPVVAVQPVYCLAPSDAPKLRLLAAIRANALLDNPIDFAADESEREAAESEEASEESTDDATRSFAEGSPRLRTWITPAQDDARDFTDFAVSGLTDSRREAH